MTLTRTKAQEVHNDAQKVLKDFAAKHGMSLPRGVGARYDEATGTIKLTLELKTLAATPAGKTSQTQELLTYAKLHGIDPSIEFTSNGRTHRLVDYNPRAKKTPFISEAHATGYPGMDVKRFRWPVSLIEFHCRPARVPALAA